MARSTISTTKYVETQYDLTGVQMLKLLAIINRPLTPIEREELLLSIHGRYCQHYAATLEQPEEGDECEEITIMYQNYDITDIFDEEFIEDCNHLLVKARHEQRNEREERKHVRW